MRAGWALAATLLVAAPAVAGKRGRNREPEPEPVVETAPPPAPSLGSLFPTPPPLDAGPVPEGLASASAQGCHACHYQAHAGWSGSAHARAWTSPDFATAAAEAGTPACLACHLPLLVQQPDLVTYDEGDIHRPVTAPNPAWDATLSTEGVTCAACHLREGKVVVGREVESAPHPVILSPELGRSEACAACHQLTWPGADQPFYDTYGEWSRSPQAAVGLQCQDCHGRGGAEGRAGLDHGLAAIRGRGISLLVRSSGVDLARGGDPLRVDVRLQNTGAGHSVPTGSPYKGLRVSVDLVGPADPKGVPALAGACTWDLGRTLEAEPPWRTLEDDRLGPGGERSWSCDLALGLDKPGGEWMLEARVLDTLRGEVRGEPVVVQRVPLRVD